ncbi:MAG: hypothetical protein AAFQ80_19405 [Cyanobacteria bacterium J06621_8]
MSKWQQKKQTITSFDSQVISAFSFLAFFPVTILSLLGNQLYSLLVILVLGGIAAKILIQHRKKHKWHWQVPQGKKLLASIGLTLISFLMVANIIVNLYHGSNRDNGRTEFNWQPENRFNPIEVFREAIDILPRLIENPEQNIYFGIFVFVSAIALIQILYAWKILYLNEQEFFQHCECSNPPKSISFRPNNQGQPKGISNFFCYRPFILKKEANSVVIQFSKVTAYDIKANFMLLAFLAVFCLAAFYGCLATIFMTLPSVMNDITNDPKIPKDIASPLLLFFIFGFPGLIQGGIAYFLWQKYLRYVFTTVIIRFSENELIVMEKAFGMRSQIANLSPSALLPLKEKRENTEVPDVRNTSLKMRYRRKNIALAGHLLPQAMDLVQDTYDRYRHDPFNTFYDQTKEAYMEQS